MTTADEAVELANEKTAYAVMTWEKAPFHIKTMAGAYMVPILEALKAHQTALEQILEEL